MGVAESSLSCFIHCVCRRMASSESPWSTRDSDSGEDGATEFLNRSAPPELLLLLVFEIWREIFSSIGAAENAEGISESADIMKASPSASPLGDERGVFGVVPSSRSS